jgi:type I restriction enzyme S subunit
VIVAMTEQAEGLLGSSAIVPEDGRYLHNQRLGLISVRDPQAVDLTFIYYLFNSPGVRQQIRASSSGVKIRHTSPSRIGEVAVSVPPFKDQRRVANILSAYDDLIQNHVRRIRILEEMSGALFNEWFVDLRFPGHRPAAAVAEHRGVPKGWRMAKLAELAQVNRAQINTKTPPERILYIDISSVGTGTIREVSSLAFTDAPGRARRVVQHGDILWSCVRPNRRSHVLVLNPDTDTVASTGFAVLTATKVPYTFLYHATTTDAFVTYLTNHATGAAYPAVTAKTFENADLLLPSEALLEQFARITVPQAELIAVLQRQNVNLREACRLLLPRLLSGQLTPAAEADPVPVEAAGRSSHVVSSRLFWQMFTEHVMFTML